jgi:acyl-coenzyme A thioesterase PaaI-like protein
MKLYTTTKSESRQTALMRWTYNFWPCIWCAGGKIEFISSDHREMHVGLKLNIRTRNRVGTVFGGSIYSSVDPYFMLMFMEILGKDYVVWDKAASVKFVRPIIAAVKCRFLISNELVEEVVQKVREQGEYTFEMPLKYEDESGVIYAVFTKTIYIATKRFYKEKLAGREGKIQL